MQTETPTSPAIRRPGIFRQHRRRFRKILIGLQNVFATKINSSGTALEFSTLLGANDYDFGFGIAVD